MLVSSVLLKYCVALGYCHLGNKEDSLSCRGFETWGRAVSAQGTSGDHRVEAPAVCKKPTLRRRLRHKDMNTLVPEHVRGSFGRQE